MRLLAIGLLCLALGAPPAAAAVEGEPPAAVASREPLWKSLALAPGRIAGHGRFDAARPSYHARRATEKAAKEESERAARCRGCCEHER